MADNREAFFFKKVPDGYVFRAPNPWIFGKTRYFLVDEAQKAQLAAIVTGRSPWVFGVALTIALAVLIGLWATLTPHMTGHSDPTISDIVILIVLVPVWMYLSFLIYVRATARRLEPLLAGLTPTDQRITPADIRLATEATTSLPQYLMLVASQAILSTVFFVQAMQTTGGNLSAAFDSGSAFASVFAGTCFAVASLCFLFAALKKYRNGPEDPAPTDRSLRKLVVPAFGLVIAIVALVFVVTLHSRTNERNHRTALIQSRLQALQERMEKLSITTRQTDLKARGTANTAHIGALLDKMNNPTVKCDSSQAEDAHSCAERARLERQAIETELAATRKEGDVIGQENASLQQELAAIQTEIEAIRKENAANR